jgi:DcmR-like sensory protein
MVAPTEVANRHHASDHRRWSNRSRSSTGPKAAAVSSARERARPNLAIGSGEHLCAIYLHHRERDDVLLPYLQDGLGRGNKCLVAISEADSANLLASITGDIDVPGSVASGQLEVRTSTDPVLRSGQVAIQQAIAFWDAKVRAALAEGYSLVRLGAEATWWMPQMSGIEELIRYESELNGFVGRYPQSILCMYELSQLDGSVVIELVKVHPRLLFYGMILENPYYLTPDEYLAAAVLEE